MLNSNLLHTGLSLVTVWFLLALVTSAIGEGAVNMLAMPSKNLWRALNQMIDGVATSQGSLSLLIQTISWPGRPAAKHPGGGAPISAKMYATRTLQGVEIRGGLAQRTRIKSIPPPILSQAILELIGDEGGEQPIDQAENFVDSLGDVPFKAVLSTILLSSKDDIDLFRIGIERWYEAQMSTYADIYRSEIRILLAMIGLFVAVAAFGLGLRSDSIELVTELQHNENLQTLVSGVPKSATPAQLEQAGEKGLF